jgi:cytochrome c556
MKIKLLSILVALGLVAAAAGCGSSHSDKKANEAYASGVCSAIGSWVTEVKSLATVTPPISSASLQKKLTQFQTATKNLVSDIKAVSPPNTSEGQNAKKQVNLFVTQVQATGSAVKSAASKIPSNASLAEIVPVLTPLKPQLTSLVSTAQSTVKSLKNVGGSLQSAFDSADACKNLGD